MICSVCGGECEWRGPLSALTHVECKKCGAVDSIVAGVEDEIDEELEPEFNCVGCGALITHDGLCGDCAEQARDDLEGK